jgi:hypothetical protein
MTAFERDGSSVSSSLDSRSGADESFAWGLYSEFIAAAEEAGSMDAEGTDRRDHCHMKCPKCGSELSHFAMSGVELDRCTKCGGIWFDPGELDDLLEEHWSVMKEVIERFREPSS